MDAELKRAYAECRRLTIAHGKTYYFSTCFFPRHLQPRVHALYGFVRYPDELVDNPGQYGEPHEQLALYRNATIRSLAGECRCLPVLNAFSDTARRHGIPQEYALSFLDAMEMDLTVQRYRTFADLCKYMYGSASVVGLMMCRIIGATSIESIQPATDLGIAMQLTNFLRDIGEDFRQRGRIYIPLEDMTRFGYCDEDLGDGVVNDQFRNLMKFEIARARCYYESADSGMRYIPVRNRLPVRLARVLYSRILDKIEQNDYDVFSRRAATSKAEKMVVALRETLTCGRV